MSVRPYDTLDRRIAQRIWTEVRQPTDSVIVPRDQETVFLGYAAVCRLPVSERVHKLHLFDPAIVDAIERVSQGRDKLACVLGHVYR